MVLEHQCIRDNSSTQQGNAITDRSTLKIVLLTQLQILAFGRIRHSTIRAVRDVFARVREEVLLEQAPAPRSGAL